MKFYIVGTFIGTANTEEKIGSLSGVINKSAGAIVSYNDSQIIGGYHVPNSGGVFINVSKTTTLVLEINTFISP